MTKIVYNACFGGFSLSDEAILRYAELKGIPLTKKADKYGFSQFYNGDKYFSDMDISRDDEVLAKVVEELGEKANGRVAELHIRDLPSGTRYRIDEYDGNESVVTIDEYEWSVA